jgi:hypothetical protein
MSEVSKCGKRLCGIGDHPAQKDLSASLKTHAEKDGERKVEE